LGKGGSVSTKIEVGAHQLIGNFGGWGKVTQRTVQTGLWNLDGGNAHIGPSVGEELTKRGSGYALWTRENRYFITCAESRVNWEWQSRKPKCSRWKRRQKIKSSPSDNGKRKHPEEITKGGDFFAVEGAVVG